MEHRELIVIRDEVGVFCSSCPLSVHHEESIHAATFYRDRKFTHRVKAPGAASPKILHVGDNPIIGIALEIFLVHHTIRIGIRRGIFCRTLQIKVAVGKQTIIGILRQSIVVIGWAHTASSVNFSCIDAVLHITFGIGTYSSKIDIAVFCILGFEFSGIETAIDAFAPSHHAGATEVTVTLFLGCLIQFHVSEVSAE